MRKRWTVVGGWALSPAVLRPVFGGEEATYMDVNELAPHLAEAEGGLKGDWQDRGAEIVRRAGEGRALAGWSLGALVALAVGPRLGCRELVLLSAGSSLGWPRRVLRRMRQRLASDRGRVIRDFLRRCGAPEGIEESPVPAEFLAAGLSFLENYSYEGGPEIPGIRIRMFHGRGDAIFPLEAGRALAARLEAPFEEFDGGHLFFLDPAVASAVRRFL